MGLHVRMHVYCCTGPGLLHYMARLFHDLICPDPNPQFRQRLVFVPLCRRRRPSTGAMDPEIDQKVTAPPAPPFVDLSGISSAVWNQHIYLRISRLWYQRGGFDDGPIKSIHMVMTDEKGNHANTTVPNEVADMFVDTLHERNLYKCARIHVRSPAIILRAVEGTHTLWFTRSTIVHRLEGVPFDHVC